MADYSPKQNFVDYVRIHVRAGDGGDGCIAFLREKGRPFGGPAGGDAGRGGHVYLEADAEMTTLLDFKMRPSWVAKGGANGGGKNMGGRGGSDVILNVPLGTTVYDLDNKVEVGDLTSPGQQLRIARGGDGGRGNQHFASATNKAPRKAETGWPGDERHLALELKVIAHGGLVGLPNAGKSTLLSVITQATPKIAPYPFTTLHPNLGVFLASDFQNRITIADIPGLIEGAHTGAGLGDRFLRHVERTHVLVHLVAPESGEDTEGVLSVADSSPEHLLYAYELVNQELAQYSASLLDKPRLVCLTKIDLLTEEEIKEAVEAFKAKGIDLLPISSLNGEHIDDLRLKIEGLVLEERQESYPPNSDEIEDPTL